MPINASEVQVAAAALAADINFLTLHSAIPDNTGSSQTTAAPVAVTPTATGGVVSIGSTSFTGGAASGPCVAVGFWHGNPTTGGTFRGYSPLTGDQTFNAAGAYTVDSVTLTGSAT
jgi:hypothetical protein